MKSKRFFSPLIRLFYDSKKQWLGFIGFIVFALLAGPLKTASAVLWGEVVDLGVSGQMSRIMPEAFIMLIFILMDAVRTAVHYKLIGHVTEKMFYQFRIRTFSVITETEMSVLENHTRSSDLAMRVNSDIEQLCDMIAGNYSNYARLIFQALFGIIGCILLSWQLSIAYFILLPISLWMIKKISLPIQQQRKEALDYTGKAVSLASEAIDGIATVKSYGLQKEMNGRFSEIMDASYEQAVKTEKISVRMTIIKYTVHVVQIMSLFLVGSLLASRSLLTIGSVISFITLSQYVTETFGMVDSMLRVYRTSTALAGRIYEILDLTTEKGGDIVQIKKYSELIKMSGLSFSYGGYSREGEILSDINIKLLEGQKIALIGPSGCGKSTLIKLICQFYQHQKGKFTLFGIDARSINISTLRSELALISQDSALFSGSIYENVACGRPDSSETEVIQAIKDAYLWEYVCSLPEGVHTLVGEFGSNLSGGQRQRLCIARAMLKGAKIILLDEATSALDTQTELEIQKAFDRLLIGKSAVIVAHRLSTIQNVDYIYCMEKGKIIEEGIPSTLLGNKGYYYRMCLQQDLIKEGVLE